MSTSEAAAAPPPPPNLRATLPHRTGHEFRNVDINERAHLGDVFNITYPPTSETPPEPSSNIPFRRDPDFVERGQLLAQLGSRLDQQAARVALVGLGGIGKSQLAIEYCYRVREKSPDTWVLWVHASNAARYEQGFREIADLAKIKGREDSKADVYKLVRDWLRQGRRKWLLVLDNVDDAGFLLENRGDVHEAGGAVDILLRYIPVCEYGSVLITSRNKDAARRVVEHSDIISIDPMGNDDAITLLEKKLGQQASKADLLELATALECMPLAMSQAAAYIERRRPRASVRQYLEALHRSDYDSISLLDRDSGDLHRDPEAKNSIFLTWSISFDYIQQTNPSAAHLLSLMSFFDRQAIPKDLLRNPPRTRAAGHESVETVKQDGSETSTHKEEDEELLSAYDEKFEDDLSALRNFSFISSSTDTKSFGMHRLVQLATRRWLHNRQKANDWEAVFIDCLEATFPSGEYGTWRDCERLFPHVMVAMFQEPAERSTLLVWTEIMNRGASYMWYRGQREGAQKLYTRVLEIRQKLLGAEHPDTLTSLFNLAMIYWSQGQFKEAEELESQVLAIHQRTLGAEHLETLSDKHQLAIIYVSQGRLKEAEELQAQVLEIRRRLLGAEHPDTLRSMNNLAANYHSQGRYKEAEQQTKQVLECRRRILGAEHPDTLSSAFNLGNTYLAQTRIEEAEQPLVQALEGSQKVLGDHHPDTIQAAAALRGLRSHKEQRDSGDSKPLAAPVARSSKSQTKATDYSPPPSGKSKHGRMESLKRLHWWQKLRSR